MGVDVMKALEVIELTTNSLTVTDTMVVGKGTVSVPSVRFAGDEDTGLYWRTTNSPAFATGGAVYNTWTTAGTHCNTVTSFAGSSMTCMSSLADAADAIGVKSNTSAAYSTAGAQIHSFQNNSVAKAFVDKDGRIEMAAIDSAPTISANSRLCFYIDETGHNLKCAVKYADGTAKTFTSAFD